VALECSMLERRAEEAERTMEAWQEAIYMKSRVGEVFDGVVTGRSRQGLFVTLDGVGVDALLPLPPPERPRPAAPRGSGRGRRKVVPAPAPARAPGWTLGDRLRVRVHDVDTFRARIVVKPLPRG
jgi:exoribonuclease R